MFASRVWICGLFSSVLLLAAKGSMAQIGDVYLYPVPGYNAAVMQQIQTESINRERENFDRNLRQGDAGRPAGLPRKNPSAGRNDFYVPNQANVSAQVKRELLERVDQRGGGGAVATIERTFQRKSVRQAFDEIVSPYGLRTDDYADVFAAHLLIMWMVANQAGLPTSAQVQAVVRQARRALAGKIASVSLLDRQRQAEGMMYNAVLAIYARNEAQRDGDSAYLSEMASRTRSDMLKQDLDMQALMLSDRGFSRR